MPSDYSKINWAFFGTDEFSVKVLEVLKTRGLIPALILTVPDQPKGRQLVMTPPPIKAWAQENNIEYLQPSSLKDSDFFLKLSAKNLSLLVVASYGKIIPTNILDLPVHGTLNIHPSLLPKYRGATPLESAILNSDDKTGVTIIKLDAEMDHGPIVAQEEISLTDWRPYYEELRDKLAVMGANLLADKLPNYVNGSISPVEQKHDEATYTNKITKEDGKIDLAENPELNYRKIRALTSWPGAYFFIEKDKKKLRVLIKKAKLENGQLKIDRVVPEGKSEMDWESFSRGYLNK